MNAPRILSYASPTARDRRTIRVACWVGMVLGILGVTAVLTAQRFKGRSDISRVDPWDNLHVTAGALDQFETDSGRFPTTAEGLQILVDPLASGRQYLSKFPKDRWGRPLVYRSPSLHPGEPFDLLSLGKDGIEGTAEDVC